MRDRARRKLTKSPTGRKRSCIPVAKFPDRFTPRPPDCRAPGPALTLQHEMRKNFHLPPEEKLAALCAGDAFREWHSLDDERFCFCCERTVSGRQIEVSGRRGHYRLHCPSPDCPASPREWIMPGDPYTSDKVWRDWQRALEDDGGIFPRAGATPPRPSRSHPFKFFEQKLPQQSP